MRALLDTHVFLWWVTDSEKLSVTARDFIRNPNNDLYVSVVSAWEILMKTRAHRLAIPGDAAKFIETHSHYYGFTFLDLLMAHVLKMGDLPVHHRDPFDQILIAQAQVENLPLISADSQIAKYAVELIW